MKFYILVEDTVGPAGLPAEHGLAIYFELAGKKYLFDTGASERYLANAAQLGIDLARVDYVALSHGHYDHTGGLPYLPNSNKRKIIAHPDCFNKKYAGERYIGAPEITEAVIRERGLKQLGPGVYFLGEIFSQLRRPHGVIRGTADQPDQLYDDTGLLIERGDDLVLLSGCAHSGICTMTEYALKLFDRKPLTLIGGFHMLRDSEEEIKQCCERLRNVRVTAVYPGHCTGGPAVQLLLSKFSGERLYSGMTVEV